MFKGVYLYEYMNSFKRFDEDKLPDKDVFISSLRGEILVMRDKKGRNVFNIKHLGEYHDFYLKTDVLLLCDVFERFIDVCLEYYGLDPCHYFSAPGLSWDAMLKMTGVELELISDIDMHLFIEKVMRGGISYIAKRYCKANNKYVKSYDRNSDNSFIMCFDANNLYGWAMSKYLPHGGFKWMSNDAFDIDYLLKFVEKDSRVGYILEVDLEYPDELHDYHNDYSLAPEKLKVSNDIVHYRNLQLYLSLGMNVTKIHRVLEFEQSDWLKKFADFNMEKRRWASKKFEENFFKLMVNSVFRKTMENLRKRINVKLVNNVKDYVKYTSKPSFVSQKTLDKNFVAIHRVKPVLLLNKPIYVGFSILELSKFLMYDFHYNYFKENFNVNLLFTDTDSLVYQIKGVYNVYDEIFSDRFLFDFSSYSMGSRFYDVRNKKVIGKMKDEMGGKVISGFIGLKSKMYSLITVDDEEKIRAKGVNVKLKHNEFYDVSFNNKVVRHNMKRIQAKKQKLGSYDVRKVSLSCFDYKRYVLDNGVDSLAYFHKDIL